MFPFTYPNVSILIYLQLSLSSPLIKSCPYSISVSFSLYLSSFFCTFVSSVFTYRISLISTISYQTRTNSITFPSITHTHERTYAQWNRTAWKTVSVQSSVRQSEKNYHIQVLDLRQDLSLGDLFYYPICSWLWGI